ncbi:RDD family protein [bacterium]|nr:RDD family protein [bacterium]
MTSFDHRVATVDTRAEIETPENVTLSFNVAGPGSRMTAYLIDLVIRVVVFWGLSFVVSAALPVLGDGLTMGGFLIGLFVLEWGYSTIFEAFWRGQTPGKRICGLRVLKDAGYPISFYDSVLRNLLRAADFLPFGYGTGLICMTSTRRLQRIGDLVAGTMVVRDATHRFQPLTEAFAKLDPIQPVDCSGTFAVSERTLDVIEQLLARRDKLPKRRVEEIAEILARPVAAKLGYRIDDDPGLDRHEYFLRRVLRTFGMTQERNAA